MGTARISEWTVDEDKLVDNTVPRGEMEDMLKEWTPYTLARYLSKGDGLASALRLLSWKREVLALQDHSPSDDRPAIHPGATRSRSISYGQGRADHVSPHRS